MRSLTTIVLKVKISLTTDSSGASNDPMESGSSVWPSIGDVGSS